jgi:hypothetical protein
MKKLNYLIILFSLLFLGACEQDLIETTEPEVVDPCAGASAGANVSFTKFVSVGNSLTAGYQAGALFTAGQNESVANIMATQFACVGMTDAFEQPTINSVNGCYNPGGGCTLGRLMLFDSDGPAGPKSAGPAPSGTPGMPAPFNSGSPVTAFAGNKATLNNFAVPGILLGQALIPDTGNPASPYFNGLWARFASQPGVKSIMQDAVAALADQGTFFMFWLGNNDVLGYAVSGGTNEAVFTSVANFTGQYGAAIDALLSVPNAKGVVGNIPSVTDIPFFKLVPYNPVVLTSQTQVDQLNAGYAPYNGGLDVAFANAFITAEERDKRKVIFTLGQNPVVIVDEYLTNLGGLGLPSYREATSGDKLVLPASSFIGTLVGGDASKINGVSVPLADQWVLSASEVALVAQRITDFNAAIAAKVDASNNRIALADANAAFAAFVTAGATVQNGIVMTPGIAPPTAAFSEDGVHPNGRGAAFVANIFITAINAKFGSTVPLADVSKYKGTRLPLNP